MNRQMVGAIVALSLAVAPINAHASSLDVNNVPIGNVITMLEGDLHENIVLGPKVDAILVSVHLTDVPPQAMLQAIEDTYGLREVRRDGYVILAKRDDPNFVNDDYETVVQVDNGTAQTLSTFIKTLYPTIDATPLDAQHVIVAGDRATVLRAATQLARFGGPTYATIDVSYQKPSEVLQYLRSVGLIDSSSAVAANDAAGTLSVQGSQDDITRIRTAIENYDQPPKRAYFRVDILEIQPNNDNSNVGIVWGSTTSSTSALGSSSTTLSPGTTLTAFVNKQIPLAAQINALINTGRAKILAHPGIGFNSSEPGMFNFSTSYPITINTGTAFVGGNVHYQDIGISLKIQGIIGKDNQITTALDATDSTIDGYDPIFNNPIIGKREVSSTITVYPNESVVLSGFDEDEETESKFALPILSRIPIIGALFRDEQKTKQKLQIVFVITPLPLQTHQGAFQQ